MKALLALIDKVGATLETDTGPDGYGLAVIAPPGKVWATSHTARLTCDAPVNDDANREGCARIVLDMVQSAIAATKDGTGLEPLIVLASTVAEVDPAQAIRDMKDRIAGLATDDAGTRAALAACIDLTREQFRLMLGAVPQDMHAERRTISDALNALEAELMFQIKLMRERRYDGRGGGLR